MLPHTNWSMQSTVTGTPNHGSKCHSPSPIRRNPNRPIGGVGMTDEQKQAFWQLGRDASQRLLEESERLGIVMSQDDLDALPAVFHWWLGLMSVFGPCPWATEAEFARAVAAQLHFYKPNSPIVS